MALQTKNRIFQVPSSLTQLTGTVTATFPDSSFSVVLSGLTANALYFLYVRNNAGVGALFFHTSIPSIYRVTYPDAVLVGAFYANGLGSPAFGSFVNIEGVPVSGPIVYEPVSQGFGTFGSSVFNWSRNAGRIKIQANFTTGTPTAVEGRIGLPGQLVHSSLTSYHVVGEGPYNANRHVLTVWLAQGGNGYLNYSFLDDSAAGSPFTPLNGNDQFGGGQISSINAETPVQGWDNVSLKDL